MSSSNDKEMEDINLDEVEVVDKQAVAVPEQPACAKTGESTESTSSSSNHNTTKRSFSEKWTDAINRIRAPILTALHYITHAAAVRPKCTVVLICLLSFALLLCGFATNFKMEGDEDRLWTPLGTKAYLHGNWIEDDSGFPDVPRAFTVFLHNHGANVLDESAVERAFEALDAVRNLPEYDAVCEDSLYVDPVTDTHGCRVWGVTKFWNNTVELFQQDPEKITTLSAAFFPDGSVASEEDLYGYPVRDSDTGLLERVQSYMVMIEFPDTDEAKEFEKDAIDVILELDDRFEADPEIDLRVEISAYRSFEDEFNRAIIVDIPLIPVVFIVMSAFAVLVFYRRDRLYSRSFLGFCGVLCVLLSLVAGYGLMFCIGITMTSMTQILPFIVFGIGLDDVFILTCSYDRSDRDKDVVERIHDTIDDVGLSITMTSLTSTMAFALGSISSIPAIRWLCVYGYPTIIIVFLFQLTFFVACMVLDEGRIRARRRDCCCCRSVLPSEGSQELEPNKHFVDHIMSRYADLLLRPSTKIVVTVCFLAVAAGLTYSTSKMTQEFEPKDLLPSDSYLREFWDAVDDYQARSGAAPFAYFRWVDQSDEDIQQQMNDYVDALVSLDSIEEPPDYFWLWDFKEFVATAPDSVSGLSFAEQIDLFLVEPAYYEMYNDHIVRDGTGTVTESRVLLFMDNVSWDDVKQQIDALKDQRSLTASQPINQGHSDWRFFTYFEGYDIWELYRVSAEELIKTSLIGVGAVSGIALLLVPHWSAFVIILPSVAVLYLELLGFMQMAGLHINAVSYIGLVMSIGLLVDFLMHILLRYYESEGTRREKTTNTLKTMGSAIFLGGMSSLLGTLPLAFSTSEMFFNIFIVFFGLVVLGTTHGLILLPVILSTVGPEGSSVKSSHRTRPKMAVAATDEEHHCDTHPEVDKEKVSDDNEAVEL